MSVDLRQQLLHYLQELGIQPVCVEHPEVFTVEEMMPHVQHLKGAHSKNLFLKDKKKKSLWLVTVLHDRQVNLNDLAKKLNVGSGNLRFADEASMLEKLKVGQGCATPLSLFCDQGDVKFVLDAQFLEGGHERVYFHPMTNSATMGLTPSEFMTFLKKTGHDPVIIHFD
ncbi:prolyl-tRNA synthetase associated domain-containing protein 1 [Rhinophrynus dorsalis]